MNRRTFLQYSLAVVTGGAIAQLIQAPHTNTPSIASSIDTEKVLLGLYDPDFIHLQALFPEISSYPLALYALMQKDMIIDGQIDLTRLNTLAKTDPIMDFQGWQHIESELLLYLAAYWLVAETRCDGKCTTAPALTHANDMVLVNNIDFYGQDIRAVKINANTDALAAEQCATLCKKEAQCDFFTLATNSHPVANKRHACWLKKEGAKANKNEGYISGIKQ